jgi:aminopeptidase N
MKRLCRPVVATAFVAACAFLAPTFARAQVITGVDTADAQAESCAGGRALRARYLAGLNPFPAGAIDEAMGDTDVLHYNLDIEVFPATTSISGTNVMTVKSLVNGLTQFTFRLRNTFTITAATLNGSTPAVFSTPTATTRVVTLDRPYNAGEVFTLAISYNGLPASGGFGSFKFSTQNGFPFIETLSEPYYAHTWWPVKDGDEGVAGDNIDKSTVEIAVTAPNTISTTSNGVLVGIDALSGGRSRYRWATNYPIAPYLVSFATGKFNTWSINYDYGQGVMPVVFNIFPSNDTAANRAGWENCVPMMQAFRGVFGLYPFVNEKYGIYNFTFGGGMEHQTNTGQSGFGESLTSHELTHQWWGDNVTCRTWSDIWLNEGFATYGEALWLERKPGSTGLPALFSAMAARRPSSFNGSVYRTNVSSTSSIFSSNFAYNKGAWVLHQLRKVVGDQAFFDILATYRAQYQGSAATSDDFAAVASSVAGRDLSWFFQEWVYGTGAPTYQFGFQNVAINGQNYLRLHIRQTQTASYGTYTMPIDVRVNYSGGNQTIPVWNNALLEHYVLPVNAPATGVVLDEFNWILAQSKTNVTYVNGPPMIVASAPAQGATVPAGLFHSTVTFSENVSATVNDFQLSRAGGPAVPLTISYSPGTFTATLDSTGPISPGSYTLTIRDTITSTASAIALDGNGDGQPGGDDVINFTVQPAACYADCNGDGVLGLADFGCFQTRFALADPYADCNGDGVLGLADFGCFQTKFALGCP